MPDIQIVLGITENGDDWDISLGTDPDDALTTEEMWETLCDVVDGYRQTGILIHIKDIGIGEQAYIQHPDGMEKEEVLSKLWEIIQEQMS